MIYPVDKDAISPEILFEILVIYESVTEQLLIIPLFLAAITPM